MAPKPTWSMEAEYIQSCNCAYGCPCAFNALPSTGSCEALVAWRVRKGSFNGTTLDGAKIAWGLWWPKAIHDGGGVSRLYIDPSVRGERRRAVEEIWGGKQGGGVFVVFNATCARTLPPLTRAIRWRFSGHDSGFSVEGIGEVQTSHIRNPVTGAKFEGQIVLPNGLNFKKAQVASVKRLVLHDEAPLDFEHTDTAGFVVTTKYTGRGPVWSRV